MNAQCVCVGGVKDKVGKTLYFDEGRLCFVIYT